LNAADSTSPPCVTGIIIVYNGEAYLDAAIASVRAQSFTDWELLVVDDGSSDGSREIVRGNALADSRVRLVEHPDHSNHGMSATRNLGLSQARGEFVGFLDADDIWLPDKLSEQLAAFAQHSEAAMVYGRTLIWHGWADSEREDFFYELGVEPDRVYAPPILFRNLLRNVYQTPTTCNALMRRSAIGAVGGFESSFKAMFEDQVFFAKMLLRFPTFVSSRCWAKYRQHDLSSSALSAAALADETEQLRYLQWLGRYLGLQDGGGMGNRLMVGKMAAKLRCRLAARRLKHRLLRRN
jgi:glycosyltransferase involved in cell wall biosynthesis